MRRRAGGFFVASKDTLCGSLVWGLWRDGDSPTWCLGGVSSSCPWEGLGRATQTSCGSADTCEVGGSGFPPQSRQTGGAGRAGVRVSQRGRAWRSADQLKWGLGAGWDLGSARQLVSGSLGKKGASTLRGGQGLDFPNSRVHGRLGWLLQEWDVLGASGRGPCVQASSSTARQTQGLTTNPIFCPWARPGAQVPASGMEVWGSGQGSCC